MTCWSCNLDQHVTQPTHLHGHTLDLILSPSDQSVVDNVKVCGFISDHALIKCSVALPTPPSKPVDTISYRRYHHIDMNTFRRELKNVPFAQSPASSVSELYSQYVHDLGALLDKDAALVSRVPKKHTTE